MLDFKYPSMRSLYEKSTRQDNPPRQHPSLSKDFDRSKNISYSQISYAESNQCTQRRDSSKHLRNKAKRQERLQTSEGDDISSIGYVY